MSKTDKSTRQALVLITLVLLVLLGIFLRWEALDAVVVNNWVLRDFERAFNIVNGNYVSLAGPEANNGGRLPGPFLYFILAIPLLFHPSYESLFIFNFILNVASIGMLFFVVRQYFGVYFSALSTALVCVNYHHIGAVNFPINPSFIFPLVVLFLWALLELVLKNNQKVFPAIIIVLSLAIQIHYSMAAFFIVPIFLVLILGIRIPTKTIFISLITAVICFTPFAAYKLTTFIPTNDGRYVTLTQPDLSSLTEIIKIITVQNTIKTITSSASLKIGLDPGTPVILTNHLMISLGTFFILVLILLKIKKIAFKTVRKKLSSLHYFFSPPSFMN